MSLGDMLINAMLSIGIVHHNMSAQYIPLAIMICKVRSLGIISIPSRGFVQAPLPHPEMGSEWIYTDIVMRTKRCCIYQDIVVAHWVRGGNVLTRHILIRPVLGHACIWTPVPRLFSRHGAWLSWRRCCMPYQESLDVFTSARRALWVVSIHAERIVVRVRGVLRAGKVGGGLSHGAEMRGADAPLPFSAPPGPRTALVGTRMISPLVPGAPGTLRSGPGFAGREAPQAFLMTCQSTCPTAHFRYPPLPVRSNSATNAGQEPYLLRDRRRQWAG